MSEPMNFLGLGPERSDPATARYVVLPVPYEQTVSYKGGTAAGPAAILDASAQVELWDEELGIEYANAGVATLPELAAAPTPAEQMARVRAAADDVLQRGQVLLTLGGEHSITAPAVAATAAVAPGPLSVLQIDAHADLRSQYEGDPHSHASVMARVLETTEHLVQVGIRSYSPEEARALPDRVKRFWTPRRIAVTPDWIDGALDELTEHVYITLDIDGLDPSLAPGTGTPEPGGLSWWQLTELLRAVGREKTVLAADVVEVRPLGENHVTEFVAARAACKIIAYTQQR